MTPDLSTSYLGLNLSSPLIIGASPLSQDLDQSIEAEKAGASAIVTYSLFEERIRMSMKGSGYLSDINGDSFYPGSYDSSTGAKEYLNHMEKLCQSVSIPVIGSLNGVSRGGWLHSAKLMEDAGAAALELNYYFVSTDEDLSASAMEDELVAVAQEVCSEVDIPVSVKLSPFYSSLPNLVKNLQQTGIAGVVLFNRFYQPDIDLDEREIVPILHLSDRSELLLRLRWLAILHGRFPISLGASGGVHQADDVIKCLMAGANGVQIVSALLKNGPQRLTAIREEMCLWMTENDYASVSDLIGIVSLKNCPDPQAYVRANYMRTLQGWMK
jgi:dihydroorotate dehydrogenase (fumarate)